MAGSAELAIKIEEPEAKQSAAGDPWEPLADLFVERNSEPGDKDTKKRGAEHVAGASQRRAQTSTLCANVPNKTTICWASNRFLLRLVNPNPCLSSLNAVSTPPPRSS